VSLTAFLLGAAGLSLGMWELGFSCLSAALVCSFLRWLALRGDLEAGLLLAGFLFGHMLSWGIGLIGCRYVLPWRGIPPEAFGSHTGFTALLAFIGTAGACLGGLAGIRLVRPAPRRLLTQGLATADAWPQLLVFGAASLAYWALTLKFMGLNARWTIGYNVPVDSPVYWICGSRTPLLAFYALLGASLKRPLSRPSNLPAGSILLVFTVLGVLTGGRQTALEPFMFCSVGALFSPLGAKTVIKLAPGIGAPLLVALTLLMGWARGLPAFAGGSAADKLLALSAVLRERPPSGSDERDPLFSVFARIFEPSGQSVIDTAAETGDRVGWLHFERLAFLYLPKFVCPDKLPLDDGWERLVESHGYESNDFSSFPITFLADAYERFGLPGVLACHVAAGALLVFLARLLLAIRSPQLCALVMSCAVASAVRLYPLSVLGFISVCLYGLARDAVVISTVFMLGRCAALLLTPLARAAPGRPRLDSSPRAAPWGPA
jgi:hypothetical protein